MCSVVSGEGRATAQSPSIVKDFRALCQPCVSHRGSENKDADVLRRQCAGASQINKKHFELTDPIEPLRLGWNWLVRLRPEEVLQIHVFINYSVCAIIVPYWSPCLVYSGSIPKCFLKQEYSPSPASPSAYLLSHSLVSDRWITRPTLWHRCAISHDHLSRLSTARKTRTQRRTRVWAEICGASARGQSGFVFRMVDFYTIRYTQILNSGRGKHFGSLACC